MWDNCEELFLLKCIFLLTHCFWLLKWSKGSNSITKYEVGKAKFWESLTYMFFFTAILITYIKGGTPAHILL
jgi:hypothetical protein